MGFEVDKFVLNSQIPNVQPAVTGSGLSLATGADRQRLHHRFGFEMCNLAPARCLENL
jgi:hypothetical protein